MASRRYLHVLMAKESCSSSLGCADVDSVTASSLDVVLCRRYRMLRGLA